jgi:acetone carboxylase gamma subunit
MTGRMSEALESRDGMVCCRGCGREVALSGTPWKPGAALDETPMRGAAGAAYGGGERVLLRRFCCPGCGALLDCEIALDGDPFLNDVICD